MSDPQVRGNPISSDWGRWEQTLAPENRSGEGVDFGRRYPELFAMAKKELSNNAIRLSVDWARVQPTADGFCQTELNHWREVIQSARDSGLAPMVTLDHFTKPEHVAALGGWTNPKMLPMFGEYVARVRDKIGDLAEWWITVNEPNVYATEAYLKGNWPPHKKDWRQALKVYLNMGKAHQIAAEVLREDADHKPIGVAQQMVDIQTFKPVAKVMSWMLNQSFLKMTDGTTDFVGINYYQPWPGKNLPKTDFGWPIDASGLQHVVEQTWSGSKKPIYITENGVSDANDTIRPRYLVDHLNYLWKAMQNGADVRGYFHWSFIDNFEWAHAWKQKFGLLAKDGSLKDSAKIYEQICRTGQLPENVVG